MLPKKPWLSWSPISIDVETGKSPAGNIRYDRVVIRDGGRDALGNWYYAGANILLGRSIAMKRSRVLAIWVGQTADRGRGQKVR